MTERCSNCKHYTPDQRGRSWQGSCALMGDANDIWDYPNTALDKCFGWDCESYSAGVYVGPEFGCIHWEAKL